MFTLRLQSSARSASILQVLIAYVDESGDLGDPALKGASGCYVLGCVLIDSGQWAAAFDHMLSFRRQIRDNFGPLLRYELKANHLIRNGGGLRRFGLAPSQRRLIYNYHLNQVAMMGGRAFAVVVDKGSAGVSGQACQEMAWETLLQRLERTTSAEGTDVMIVHDEGDNASVRKIVRRSRRHMTAGAHFGGGGTYHVPLRRLIEDPVPRASHESYMLQLADLVAYSGWRTYVAPGPGAALVADGNTWSQLGPAIHRKVNALARRGAAGVVIRY